MSVIGNFNHWDGRRHPMRKLRHRPASGRSSSPTSSQGEVYKFEIKSRSNGYLVEKSDPYGFAAEMRPRDRVGRLGRDRLHVARRRVDGEPRQDARASTRRSPSTRSTSAPGSGRPRRGTASSPIASWPTNWSSTSRRLDFTHIELMPISEHPFDG